VVLHVLDGLLARPAEMVQPCVDHQPRGAHELVAEVAEQVVALRAVRLGLEEAKLARQLLRVEGPPVASRAIASEAIASGAIASRATVSRAIASRP